MGTLGKLLLRILASYVLVGVSVPALAATFTAPDTITPFGSADVSTANLLVLSGSDNGSPVAGPFPGFTSVSLDVDWNDGGFNPGDDTLSAGTILELSYDIDVQTDLFSTPGTFFGSVSGDITIQTTGGPVIVSFNESGLTLTQTSSSINLSGTTNVTLLGTVGATEWDATVTSGWDTSPKTGPGSIFLSVNELTLSVIPEPVGLGALGGMIFYYIGARRKRRL